MRTGLLLPSTLPLFIGSALHGGSLDAAWKGEMDIRVQLKSPEDTKALGGLSGARYVKIIGKGCKVDAVEAQSH